MAYSNASFNIAATKEGLNYGAVSEREVMLKLEETDMGDDRDGYRDTDTDYAFNKYSRMQIVDRNPDKPFLEGDKTWRTPQRANEHLSIRYNSDRSNMMGNNPSSGELPTHPEMFYGLTEKDPRGISTDVPLYRTREFMTGAKGARMQVPMGNNDDNHVADEPIEGWKWNQLNVANRKMTRRNMKVFAQEYMGRGTNNNGSNRIPYAASYALDSENAIQAEWTGDNQQYFQPATPGDFPGIYSKVSPDIQFKHQVLQATKLAKQVSDDVSFLQYQVENMARFNRQEESKKGSGTVQPKDYVQTKYLSEKMQDLSRQLQAVTREAPTSANVHKVQQLSEQLMALGNTVNSMTRKSVQESQDKSIIHSYSDATRMQSTGADIQSILNKKNIEFTGDEMNVFNYTENDMDKKETLKTHVYSGSTPKRRNNTLGKQMIDYNDNVIDQPKSVGYLPKSMRKVMLNTNFNRGNIPHMSETVAGRYYASE